MKKTLLVGTLLVLVMASIAVVSCKKDKPEQTSNNNEMSVRNPDNMDDYILAFKDKLLSAEKDGETISLEDARRELSNLLNFDFDDANNPFDVFVYDTLFVKIKLTNGMVGLSDLASAYDDALNMILVSYRALDLSDKTVFAVFCDYDGTDSDDSMAKMRIVVAYRGLTERSFPHTVDTNDWRPTRYSSSCDGLILHIGAPEVMEEWMLDTWLIPSCENGGRVYFTEDLDPLYIKGYETYDPVEGRFKVFAMYTNRIDTVCITHEDMEYYYDNIVDYWNQSVPVTHVLTYVTINSPCDPCSSPLCPGDLYYWSIFARHGKPNCTEVDPLE